MWARRYAQNSWQFPQGGINPGETAEQAMYRELYEEVGLKPDNVKILAVSRVWLRYKLPKRMVRWDSKPLCIGQKQRWFLLELISPDEAVNMISNSKPEFDGYRWVTYWYPIRQVVSFKRDVYRRALKEFAPFALALQSPFDMIPMQSLTFSFDKKNAKTRPDKNTQMLEMLTKESIDLTSVDLQKNNISNSPCIHSDDKPLNLHETKADKLNEKLSPAEEVVINTKVKKKTRSWPKRFKKKHKNT
ncbi:8-oxo-dGTP pyrophosphatase MutT, NUDIX family [Thorsellia anophelis DSM 18579]|uniref:8-oxo-dGTP pyrophosphatase MutT, NUDIX family n=1 Tax=Thorsellia anophelis DSM 18579 TaxID=1123402 RepID=A0A1H9ZS97_9GAMM|nr:8-oxo-dGTP pyrophosphatase MutT, NUDIX family [Thorsellia anophelis DSM 18579]